MTSMQKKFISNKLSINKEIAADNFWQFLQKTNKTKEKKHQIFQLITVFHYMMIFVH